MAARTPAPTHRNILRLALIVFYVLSLVVPVSAFAEGAGVAYINTVLLPNIYDNVMIAFGGFAILGGFFYGYRLVISANSESALSEAGNSIVYALFGFAVIALAEPFAVAFGVRDAVSPAVLNPGFLSVVDYLLTAGAGIFTLIVTVVGLRMFTTQGDTGEAQRLQKVLVTNIVGGALMLLAKVITIAVGTSAERRNPTFILEEMRGVAVFLLTIVGTISVIALILAGVFLIVSIDESLRDRAKRTIIGTLITLAVVMISYTALIAFL